MLEMYLKKALRKIAPDVEWLDDKLPAKSTTLWERWNAHFEIVNFMLSLLFQADRDCLTIAGYLWKMVLLL